MNKKKKFDISWQAIVETGLLKKVLFTIAMLALYRLGVQISLPDLDQQVFQANSNMLSSGILGMVDMFAGGALSALSIVALGIGPFITASIMMQLLGEVFPSLKTLQRENGEEGRRQYQQWTRRLALLLSCFQGFALAKFLHFTHGQILAKSGAELITHNIPGWLFIFKIVVLLAAGSMFVMWLGELISEFGIGNGGSLLIFAGIAAQMPRMIINTVDSYNTGSIPTWGLIVFLAFLLLVVLIIIALQEGVRKLAIVGMRANFGREISANSQSNQYLPLKVNPAGVLPIIFASMMMFVPYQLLSFFDQGQQASITTRIHDIFANFKLTAPLITAIDSNEPVAKVFESLSLFVDRFFTYSTVEYSILFFVMIMIFAYFYASIMLPPREIAENLQKGGTALQGLKPGKPTGDFLVMLVNRLVFIGGSVMALITVLPMHVEKFCGITTLGGLGSTSLIIMVGVAIDLFNQMMSYLQSHQYKTKSLLN